MTDYTEEIRTDIKALKERISHLTKIAQAVGEVEEDEGNRSEASSIGDHIRELEAYERKLKDSVSGSDIDREVLLEVVADLRDLDERLTKEVKQLVSQEASSIGRSLREIAEEVEKGRY